MKGYRNVAEFFYGSKKYLLLLDDDDKFFFLRIFPNKKVGYVSLQELIKLTYLFVSNPNVQLIEDGRKKNKIIPKVIIGTTTVTISLSLIALINKQDYAHMYDNSRLTSYEYGDAVSYTEEVALDDTQMFIKDALKDLEKQKSNMEEVSSIDSNLYQVYDFSGLDYILEYDKDDITYDTVLDTINNSLTIPSRYKAIMATLVNNMKIQYPYLDLRVWYENLKSLKVIELDEKELKQKTMNQNAYAVYRKDENTIYTCRDYIYKPGTWEYQVIVHECTHPISNGHFNINGKNVYVNFETKTNRGSIINEALNSILALRSYDPEGRDIAYQLQSNMLELMINSMNNYTLQDYIEHNLKYFEQKLNEFNGNMLASDIITLIELQYKNFHNNKIHVEKDQFYPVYDYIAKMYYSKYISEGMSYDSAIQVRDNFIDRLTYGVPDEYAIDFDHLREYFNDYCREVGINISRSR